MFGINPETELEILFNNLPKRPYCGHLKQHSYITEKKNISKYSYIQYQHPQIAKYIVIDCDGDAINYLYDTNLYPNLFVKNIDNGKAHLFYRLKDFVSNSCRSRAKPQKALRLLNHSIINYGLEIGANSDPRFNGQKSKNPFSTDFQVFSYRKEAWEFSELFDNIPEHHIYTRKPVVVENREIVEVTGRNCNLFDKVRFEAYKTLSRYRVVENFENDIHHFACKQNEFYSVPLAYGEVKSIVNSVTKWTWNNYTGEAKNRGVMELDLKGHNLSKSDKQSLGANYTNEKRKETSYKAISEAFYSLLNEGKKPTQKAVSERSGKSLRTVKTYWKQINN